MIVAEFDEHLTGATGRRRCWSSTPTTRTPSRDKVQFSVTGQERQGAGPARPGRRVGRRGDRVRDRRRADRGHPPHACRSPAPSRPAMAVRAEPGQGARQARRRGAARGDGRPARCRPASQNLALQPARAGASASRTTCRSPDATPSPSPRSCARRRSRRSRSTWRCARSPSARASTSPTTSSRRRSSTSSATPTSPSRTRTEELRSGGQLSAVRSDISKRKALEWLVTQSEVVDEDGNAVPAELLALPEHDHDQTTTATITTTITRPRSRGRRMTAPRSDVHPQLHGPQRHRADQPR